MNLYTSEDKNQIYIFEGLPPNSQSLREAQIQFFSQSILDFCPPRLHPSHFQIVGLVETEKYSILFDLVDSLSDETKECN